MQTYITKGVVLRTIPYNETSLIVWVFTRMFGLQRYIIKGVRKSTKGKAAKANYFIPGALLEMEVYHNQFKELQFIKTFNWLHLCNNIFSNVPKNCVALFFVELLQNCIREPEPNEELFDFVEANILQLNEADDIVTGYFPLYLLVKLPVFFGVQMLAANGADFKYFDLEEGKFVITAPRHAHVITETNATAVYYLLVVHQPAELPQLQLTHAVRQILINQILLYYQLHFSGFKPLKSLQVLRQIL